MNIEFTKVLIPHRLSKIRISCNPIPFAHWVLIPHRLSKITIPFLDSHAQLLVLIPHRLSKITSIYRPTIYH